MKIQAIQKVLVYLTNAKFRQNSFSCPEDFPMRTDWVNLIGSELD
jgi:hypothetical protein